MIVYLLDSDVLYHDIVIKMHVFTFLDALEDPIWNAFTFYNCNSSVPCLSIHVLSTTGPVLSLEYEPDDSYV